MKRISMKKIREIIRLLTTTDLSLRKISRAVNVSRPAITEYIDKFNKSGLLFEEIEKLNDDSLESVIKKKNNNLNERYLQLSSKLGYYAQELKKPYVTIQKLWEEYITEHPDGYSRSQFSYYFQIWRKASELTMHIEHKCGDKMFVDFAGKKLFITDRTTGERKEVETFVAILPASHYTFVCVTENQKTLNWIKGTEEALWYFEGVPRAIVPDCYKSAVTRHCRYEPDINPEYARFAEHYNTAIIPARPMHPDDKALVENAVKIVYSWIYAALRNEVFYSISELNHAILIELEKYNAKKMQVSGLSRLDLFNNTEKNTLANLPLSFYEPKLAAKATIQSCYHVLLSEDKHYYSVPYIYYTKSLQDKKIKAELLYTEDSVEIYYKNERIALHKRDKTRNGYTTQALHMPEAHRAYLERWNPEKIISLAKSKGEDVAELIEKILENHKHPEQSYNSCKGIVFLSKTFGNERLNKACRKAMYFGRHSYKAVQEILANKREEFEETPDLFESVIQEHSNIRGKEYYSQKLKEVILDE